MSLTKQHFDAVAQGFLRVQQLQFNYAERPAVRVALFCLACQLSGTFYAFNRQFDHKRFLLACGFTEEETTRGVTLHAVGASPDIVQFTQENH